MGAKLMKNKNEKKFYQIEFSDYNQIFFLTEYELGKMMSDLNVVSVREVEPQM